MPLAVGRGERPLLRRLTGDEPAKEVRHRLLPSSGRLLPAAQHRLNATLQAAMSVMLFGSMLYSLTYFLWLSDLSTVACKAPRQCVEPVLVGGKQ